MRKPVFGFDIDGVLADGIGCEVDIALMQGAVIDPVHYQTPRPYWTCAEDIWRAHDVDVARAKKDMNERMSADQSAVLPIAGSAPAIKVLSAYIEPVAISSRPEAWGPATRAWLDNCYDGAFVDLVVGVGRQGTATKGDVCVERGVVHLLDDFHGHCLSALERSVQASLCGDFGWHYEAPDHLNRLPDWGQDTIEYLLRLAGAPRATR